MDRYNIVVNVLVGAYFVVNKQNFCLQYVKRVMNSPSHKIVCENIEFEPPGYIYSIS